MNQYSHEFSAEKYDTWLLGLIKCNLDKISVCDIVAALGVCVGHFDTIVENLSRSIPRYWEWATGIYLYESVGTINILNLNHLPMCELCPIDSICTHCGNTSSQLRAEHGKLD